MLVRQAFRRRRARLIALVAVAVAVSDASTRLLEGFWRNHSMISAIASGLLFLGIGFFVIEELLKLVDANRSKRITGVAYRSIVAWTMRLGGLLEYCSGGDGGVRRGFLDAELQGELDDARARHPGLAHESDLGTRLHVLLDDPKWVETMRAVCIEVKDAYRDLVARWAPVILADESFGTALNDVAKLSDFASDLDNRLWLVQNARSDQLERDRRVAIELWVRYVDEVEKAVQVLDKRAAFEDAALTGAAEVVARRA